MNTPELFVRHSETIAAELAFRGQALQPSGDDIVALTNHLGLKTPNSMTVGLVYPDDQVLFAGDTEMEDPTKADVASAGMQDLSIFPEGTLPIAINELSERNILRGFAYGLMRQAQYNRRMKVIKWGAAATFAEIFIGSTASTAEGPGLNWGLLGIPLAGITLGGVWLAQRNVGNTPIVMPSLRDLESPIRIVPRLDAAE